MTKTFSIKAADNSNSVIPQILGSSSSP